VAAEGVPRPWSLVLRPSGTADDSQSETGFVICPSRVCGPGAIKMEIHFAASAECSLEWRDAASH